MRFILCLIRWWDAAPANGPSFSDDNGNGAAPFAHGATKPSFQNTRRPDVHRVLQHFVPALALQEEPHLATQGDLPPAALTITRERRIVITEANPEPPTNLPTSPTALIGHDQTVSVKVDIFPL